MKDEKDEWFADDRGIIPDYIKKMTSEELDEYIAKREIEYFGRRVTHD